MNKNPSYFFIFKLIGVVGIVAAVTGIILSIVGFGDFESNNFMIGGFLTAAGFIMGGVGIMIGFMPEISKATAKTARYIQQENKDDLSAIASTSAEIMSDALTKTASALSEGARKTMFCKHCGAKIDADSRFCSVCGKEQ